MWPQVAAEGPVLAGQPGSVKPSHGPQALTEHTSGTPAACPTHRLCDQHHSLLETPAWEPLHEVQDLSATPVRGEKACSGSEVCCEMVPECVSVLWKWAGRGRQ